jgi:hypothetical protein
VLTWLQANVNEATQRAFGLCGPVRSFFTIRDWPSDPLTSDLCPTLCISPTEIQINKWLPCIQDFAIY